MMKLWPSWQVGMGFIQPCMIHTWKKMLQDGAVELFERGKKTDKDHESPISDLYRQIGQLTVEKVLLSIKPEFAEKIFDGQKIFEFRKSVFVNRDVNYIVLYATMPTGKIVGYFKVGGILSSQPEELWEKTKAGAGISREYFMEYFKGRSIAHAICVHTPRRYRLPITLPSECLPHPPQSFRYIHASISQARCKILCPDY